MCCFDAPVVEAIAVELKALAWNDALFSLTSWQQAYNSEGYLYYTFYAHNVQLCCTCLLQSCNAPVIRM